MKNLWTILLIAGVGLHWTQVHGESTSEAHEEEEYDIVLFPDIVEDTTSVASDSSLIEREENPRNRLSNLKPQAAPPPALKDTVDIPFELSTKVVSSRPRPQDPLKLRREYMKIMSSTLGDPIRSISRAPGVHVQNDLNARPYVRGGSAEETRVLFNGVPLLMPYHLGGVFSVFNLESVGHLQLHNNMGPVEYADALSGLIDISSRTPDYDTLALHADVSMLRSNLFASGPLVKNKLSLQFGMQHFLFGHSLQSILNGLSHTSDDTTFRADIQNYKNRLNLPEFYDLGFGFAYQITPNLALEYNGFISRDDYQVVIPAAQNIIPKSDPNLNPSPGVLPDVNLFPRQEINRSKQLAVDSLSRLKTLSQAHILKVPWYLNPTTHWEFSLGYQTHSQDVMFKEGFEIDGPLALSVQENLSSFGAKRIQKLGSAITLTSGLDYSNTFQGFETHMPYPLYDVIANSNLDMLGGLGFYTSRGFTIQRRNSEIETTEYLGDLPLRVQLSQSGKITSHRGAIYTSLEYKPHSKISLYGGARLSGENRSREIFAGPRIGATWRPVRRHKFSLWSGLYAQNNYPFHMLSEIHPLKSEKSGSLVGEYQWVLSPRFEIKWTNYYKTYYDLAAPHLIPLGGIDPTGLMVPLPESGLPEAEIAALQDKIKDQGNLNGLSPEELTQANFLFGEYSLGYSNSGKGWAAGTEAGLFYRYTPTWHGWMTVSLGNSRRRDKIGGDWYDYRFQRPWSFNWVNYFKMPSQYEISFNFTWSAGHPYTPYSGTLQDGGSPERTPIAVGGRNSGRLAGYSRGDIRLTKNTQVFGRNLKTYMEIWNTFNRPNYFARDAITGELKSAELNWPFPFLFFGLSLDI